ncbi:hypothetical protein AB0I27_22890 [Streptomyces sp. NPDC050597]|uniref:hypothetical protein n=1 Tax=Streptomyces sp. NPDC050597 TaxID=3157212 RepID=UPI00341D0D40
MTHLWTPAQITAHATALRQTHGASPDALVIAETADQHGVDVDDFTGPDWDAYIEAVEEALRAPAVRSV